MTTLVQTIVQSLYTSLASVIHSNLFVERIRQFDPAEIPFTNILSARGHPPTPEEQALPVVNRLLEVHFISTCLGPDALTQCENRRALIHNTIMVTPPTSIVLPAPAKVIRIIEGVWENYPDQTDDGIGLLKTIQQYLVMYRSPRDTL